MPKRPKEKAPEWVQQLFKQASEKAITQMELASNIGVGQSNIGDYLAGLQTPSIQTLERLLKYLGGDLLRALPGYLPAPAGEFDPILDAGSVTGGVLSIADHDINQMHFQDLWRDSPWWSYVNHTEPIITVAVNGTSMEPHYPHGCRIALGRWNGNQLPDRAPCVFRSGNEQTFKQLRTTPDKQVIGWPLNSEHEPVIFKRKPVIDYIVLGVCNARPEQRPGTIITRKKAA